MLEISRRSRSSRKIFCSRRTPPSFRWIRTIGCFFTPAGGWRPGGRTHSFLLFHICPQGRKPCRAESCRGPGEQVRCWEFNWDIRLCEAIEEKRINEFVARRQRSLALHLDKLCKGMKWSCLECLLPACDVPMRQRTSRRSTSGECPATADQRNDANLMSMGENESQ